MEDQEKFVQRPVTRCVCANVTFAQMKALGVTTLEEAARKCQAGITCQSCVPYIRKMLETGETEFEVLGPLSSGEG